MAKERGGSAFDDILVKFPNDEDRSTFLGLAERNQELKDSVLRQSDYSRFMAEKQGELAELGGWRDWRTREWVPDPDDASKGYTKSELKAIQEAEALRTEKERLENVVKYGLGEGGDMNFEDIEKWGTDWAAKKGFVSAADMQKEKDSVLAYTNGLNQFTAQASVVVPWLNQRHEKEFGEPFNPLAFYKAANEKNARDLEAFYEKDWVVEARNKKTSDSHAAEIKRVQEQHTQELEKVKQEAADREARMQGMSPNGSPTDAGEGGMTPMQKQLLGLGTPDDGIPKGTKVGGGTLAALAAAEYRTTGKV